MKRFASRLILGLLITCLHLPTVTAQSPKMIETAVSRYMIMLDEDMHALMEMDARTTMALAMQLKNDEANRIMSESFEILQIMLRDSAGLELMPIGTLEGAVKYSMLGFPIGTLKKAAKNSDYDQYVQIDIMVEQPQSTTTSTSTNSQGITGVSQGYERTKIRPQVRVVLKFADDSGKNIGRYVGKYKHDDKFEIDAATIGIGGFQLAQNIAVEPLPYHFLLTKAIEDLITKLPN
ncbi:MAG: hypothetical protein JXR10_13850 [Cyclobacteriaceae bacterium]